MSEFTSYKCDGERCTKTRVSDSNNWLMGYVSDSHGPVIVVMPMDASNLREFAGKENLRHFCGENCAVNWFQRELSEMRKHA